MSDREKDGPDPNGDWFLYVNPERGISIRRLVGDSWDSARWETVEIGANVLAGIVEALEMTEKQRREGVGPFTICWSGEVRIETVTEALDPQLLAEASGRHRNQKT